MGKCLVFGIFYIEIFAIFTWIESSTQISQTRSISKERYLLKESYLNLHMLLKI